MKLLSWYGASILSFWKERFLKTYKETIKFVAFAIIKLIKIDYKYLFLCLGAYLFSWVLLFKLRSSFFLFLHLWTIGSLIALVLPRMGPQDVEYLLKIVIRSLAASLIMATACMGHFFNWTHQLLCITGSIICLLPLIWNFILTPLKQVLMVFPFIKRTFFIYGALLPCIMMYLFFWFFIYAMTYFFSYVGIIFLFFAPPFIIITLEPLFIIALGAYREFTAITQEDGQ